jgi:hypothetical protein
VQKSYYHIFTYVAATVTSLVYMHLVTETNNLIHYQTVHLSTDRLRDLKNINNNIDAWQAGSWLLTTVCRFRSIVSGPSGH